VRKRKVLYKQCVLHLKKGKGFIKETAWIPLKFAKKGRILKIRDIDGWSVVSVSSQIATLYDIDRMSRESDKQREASDI